MKLPQRTLTVTLAMMIAQFAREGTLCTQEEDSGDLATLVRPGLSVHDLLLAWRAIKITLLVSARLATKALFVGCARMTILGQVTSNVANVQTRKAILSR